MVGSLLAIIKFPWHLADTNLYPKMEKVNVCSQRTSIKIFWISEGPREKGQIDSIIDKFDKSRAKSLELTTNSSHMWPSRPGNQTQARWWRHSLPLHTYIYLVSRLAIISLTLLILFELSLTLLISVLFPRAVLMRVIFLTFTMFLPCGLFKKLSISSKAFSAPSVDWNLSIGCNAKRSSPVLHHLLTWYGKDIAEAKLPKAPSQWVKSWHLISGWDWESALGIKN